MGRSLIRRAGCVSIAAAALFAGSLMALPATSAGAGEMNKTAATLQVQKVVGFNSEVGFTVHVSCWKVYTRDLETESYLPHVDLPFNPDGSPDDSYPIPYWDVVDGTWQHDFRHGGVTCTVNETDQGDAELVSYACSWDSGDQNLAASLGVEYPGCPGESAAQGPYPDESGTVTLEGCGDSGILTVYNDLFDPTLPHTDPGTVPSGNPLVTTTTTPVPPVTPVAPVTPAAAQVAHPVAAAAVVAAAHFTG